MGWPKPKEFGDPVTKLLNKIKPEKTKVFDPALYQHMTKPMKTSLKTASHCRGPAIFLL
jgi:hypothetical protein